MKRPMLWNMGGTALAVLAITGSAFAQRTPEPPTPPTPPNAPHAPHCEVRVLRSFGGGTFLGVVPSDITTDKATSLGMSTPTGVVLDKVIDDGPAKAAGLQENDVIVKWNGTAVESAAQLRRLIHETPAGRVVKIGYIRSGATMETDVKLAEQKGDMNQIFRTFGDSLAKFESALPKDFEQHMKEFGKHMEVFTKMHGDSNCMARMHVIIGGNGRMGTMLQDLSPQLSKYFGLNDRSGALVGSVREKSPAADAGIQAGDVILEIDGAKVANPMDAQRIISGKGEGDVSVTILRDKAERTVTVHLKAPEKGMFPPMDGPLFNGVLPFGGEIDGPMQLFMEFPEGGGEVEQEIEVAPNEEGTIGNPDLGNLLAPERPQIVVRRRGPHAATTPMTPLPPPVPAIGI